ncbi:TonB family protein [Crocinitomicaceae bacterium]|nr:TonB family protein [Crocinitomicaceae bacterium]MDC0257779.1 TonB family protein [Crocinitomicaceae bacterium]
METKKIKEKNLDSLRMPLALTGLLFTGGLILASFSYVTPIEEELMSQRNSGEQVINITQEDEPDTPDEPIAEEDTYVAPPQAIIDSVDNTITPPAPEPVVLPPRPTPRPTPGPTVSAEIITFPDVEAVFPGGQTELSRYIVNNIEYPEVSIDMEEQGRVYLSFVVEKDGGISNVKVERGVSKDLDREAKRIVRAMPKWEAGEVGGKKVRTRCSLPIVFTLR